MRFLRTFAALLATAAMLAVAPAPALAAPEPEPSASTTAEFAAPPSSCASLSVCGYVDEYYATGEGYEWVTRQQPCEAIGHDNAWSSVYNNSGRPIRLYRGYNCTGAYLSLANGGGYSNLTLTQPLSNDKFSSVQFR